MPHVKPSNNGLSGSPSGSPKSEYITFTDKSIKHLQPATKRRVVWARGLIGLGIRITPKGTKSFVYKYDIDGQDRWLTFGQYPKLKLAEALKKYGEALETRKTLLGHANGDITTHYSAAELGELINACDTIVDRGIARSPTLMLVTKNTKNNVGKLSEKKKGSAT